MATGDAQHVFISYVKEDKASVDKLCRILEAAQIPYWRDRKDLAPGDAWKQKIREAVRSGSLTFLACFSDASRSRTKSYMNEELTLAVDEFRLRPPGATWLIPVRFDEGEVPAWDLGGGRTLDDLNYADLFGESYAENAAGLIATINRLMGSAGVSPATTQAALSEAEGGRRSALLARLTKEMLPDPSRRIELDDLISQETRRVVRSIEKDDRFQMATLPSGTDDQIIAIVEGARAYWALVEPMCWSLQIAARWADAETFKTWAKAVQSIAAEGLKPLGGMSALVNLRALPALCLLMVGGVAAHGQERWENLRSLAVDAQVSVHGVKLPLVDSLYPYTPFRDDQWVPNVLARSVIQGQDAATVLAAYSSNEASRYYTPVEEWLHHVLKPLFEDQFVADVDYDAAYSATEILFGLLSQDAAIQQRENGGWRSGSHWFGRSTWQARYGRRDPVADVTEGLEEKQTGWAPLKAGLFGGRYERATEAAAQYREVFEKVAGSRF
ncbi:hypothetical protein A9Z40_01980 [Microbacterium arborescens]|uniref:TIR domain-containing protein n=1 Tax=Microbacterium arborescens TaxID=33883 RepID=A0ABX2WJ72_9MICO|nr:toll/interleukin-1 receptor domain-containing protein [Microbacterium arborescens]OAZ41469.1 hypothetical protein A9Z40_01980 [Microbacterium arborescens]